MTTEDLRRFLLSNKFQIEAVADEIDGSQQLLLKVNEIPVLYIAREKVQKIVDDLQTELKKMVH